jgi:acyl carrier protein
MTNFMKLTSPQTFFDAFAEYRIARGLPAVSMALPVVLDVGYVADRDLTEQLKVSLGAFLTAVDLQTLVKGAIIGPSSGLNHNGKAITFGLDTGSDTNTLPWQCLNPRLITQLAHAEEHGPETNGPIEGGDTRSNGLGDANGGDPFENLLNALMSKVSSITMIERDDVQADAPLANYSLDSLVSVELRNWIRKETGVDLPLPKIVRAPNLRAVATQIASLRK